MKTLLLLFALFFFSPLFSQSGWSLKKDKEGIKVYTENVGDSRFKMVKVECTMDASLSQLASLLLHAENLPQWVLSTKKAYVVKRISASEVYYYCEMNTPWPISRRDMVIELSVSQDSVTKIMTVHADNIDKIIPDKPGIIRVPISHATWIVTPLRANKIKITYTIRIDPGGGVPAWMVNMFIVKIPYESFRKLKTFIKETSSKEIVLNFLKN